MSSEIPVPHDKQTVFTKKSSGSLLSDLNSLRPLISKADKWRYVILFFALFCGALLDTLGLSLIPLTVAMVTSPEKFQGWPVLADLIADSRPAPLLITSTLAILCMFVLKTVYFFFMYRFQYQLIAGQQVKLSQQLFTAYMHAPWEFHLKHNSSKLMRNISAATNEIVNGIFSPILSVTLGVVTTLMILAINVITLPLFSLVPITLVLIAMGLLISGFRGSLTSAGTQSQLEKKRSFMAINEGLSAILDWKLLGRENFAVDRFTTSVQRFTKAQQYKNTMNAILPYMVETTAILVILLVIILLSWDEVSLVSLTTYVSVLVVSLVRLRQTVSKIVNGIGQMHFTRSAIHSVVSDIRQLRSGLPKRNKRAAPEPVEFNDSLVFRDVTFAFGNDRTEPVLQNINFEIAKNEAVAIVGPTGSGKSTILNLLLGFLEPTEGTITIDSQSIQSNSAGWQRLIGYVPQSILLLDDTIIRNIAFGVHDRDIDVDRVKYVLKLAQLNVEHSMTFPDGLQTIVGERGVRLSGGQQQRLGIARALYHPPAVIVLDEATSALDSNTEAQLIATLRNLRPQVTFVFVTHRITTVSHCDRIYCVEDGRITAVGSHSELIERSSLYRNLAR